MNIGKCIEHEFAETSVGVVGFLSERGLRYYQDFSEARYFYSPSDDVRKIFSNDITIEAQDEFCAIISEQIRQLKQQKPQLGSISVATPALDLLSSEQLSDLGLEKISPSELVAEHCVQNGIRRPALIGTEWDTAPGSPLIRVLEDRGIEPLTPRDRAMRHLLTVCALNAMQTSVQYANVLREANDFCIDVIRRMLYESANTLDALVICNAELRPFISRIHPCLKQQIVGISVVDIALLHWSAIAAKVPENPPS